MEEKGQRGFISRSIEVSGEAGGDSPLAGVRKIYKGEKQLSSRLKEPS